MSKNMGAIRLANQLTLSPKIRLRVERTLKAPVDSQNLGAKRDRPLAQVPPPRSRRAARALRHK
jgi:hypothetical protein